MPRCVIDHLAIVRPPNLWLRIRLDLTLEDEPFAIVLLLDGGFLDERRCKTVDLSGRIHRGGGAKRVIGMS